MSVAAPPAADPAADTLTLRVLQRRVAAIYANYPSNFAARLAFLALVAPVVYLQFQDWRVPVLLAVQLPVNLFCLFVVPRWTPAEPLADSPVWASRLTRVAMLLGAADALIPALLVTAGNEMVTMLLTVLLMGNCMRVVQSLRPLMAPMLWCALPMMLSLIVSLAWQATTLHLLLATYVAVFLAMALGVGVRENRELSETLMLRFEKEGLAARLNEKIAAVEQASAEKTRFLATASHDLRQPMHAIALFGAAMQQALRDHPEGRNAERLMRAVDALGTSLDAMLDVSRLDAGVITAAPRAIELDTLLLALNQVFLPQAGQKSLQLRVRASGLWVHSDPHLLYRMLSNLLDNALKYTRHGGVTVIARPRGEQVWLEVRDTGIGIVPQQLERIFEEFYQIDNPGRDRARGLGIGLSIVQRLARLLGHTVQVRSRPGRGTRFRLVLPLAEAQETSEPTMLELPPELRSTPVLRGRVLLVDDEAEIRSAMTQLLGAHGIAVEAVASEAEARTALARCDEEGSAIAVLMCDYRLAGEDGLAVGQRLRERCALEAPLLIVTGETSPERLQHVRASGVPVLFKPVSAQTLLRTLAELSSATAPKP
ncbi:ATP-binding protein [Acidovorax cavernicola]|uniref:histidine kinase n=1 Tax=Acidovorax cavernicola TaxID=1675792 RepID=A0A9X8D4A7_9BURK|nr:ATP-binding protein [Acidovorax cavernicola]RIX78649.1 response regulator [Acidovorax cavernicola]